jgi:prolyl oligopeptidase PreP (S9A serine peptidase family)
MTINGGVHHKMNHDDDDGNKNDSYIGLEEMGTDGSKRFVQEANKFCLTALKDPTESDIYPKILKILENDERIPIVTKMGVDDQGNAELYNLWKDAKVCVSIMALFFCIFCPA